MSTAAKGQWRLAARLTRLLMSGSKPSGNRVVAFPQHSRSRGYNSADAKSIAIQITKKLLVAAPISLIRLED